MTTKKPMTASDMGKKGGKSKSPRKLDAIAKNAKLGGRPRAIRKAIYWWEWYADGNGVGNGDDPKTRCADWVENGGEDGPEGNWK